VHRSIPDIRIVAILCVAFALLAVTCPGCCAGAVENLPFVATDAAMCLELPGDPPVKMKVVTTCARTIIPVGAVAGMGGTLVAEPVATLTTINDDAWRIVGHAEVLIPLGRAGVRANVLVTDGPPTKGDGSTLRLGKTVEASSARSLGVIGWDVLVAADATIDADTWLLEVGGRQVDAAAVSPQWVEVPLKLGVDGPTVPANCGTRVWNLCINTDANAISVYYTGIDSS
jgi:hypothetical protein